MAPLTVEQESLICSDDTVEKDHVGDKSSVSTLETESSTIVSNSENENDTKVDIISPSVSKVDTFTRSANILMFEIPLLEDANSADKNIGIVETAPEHDDLEISGDFRIDPVPPGLGDIPSELSNQTVASSSYPSTLKELADATSFSTGESVIVDNVNIGNPNSHVDLFSVDADSKVQIPGFTNDQAMSHFHSLDPTVRTVEISDNVDLQSSFEDATVTVDSVSIVNEQNLQVPTESNTNHPVYHSIKEVTSEMIIKSDASFNEEVLSQLQSMSAPEGQEKNEYESSSEGNVASNSTEINKKEISEKSNRENDESSLFESIAPKRSFSPYGIPAPILVSEAMQVPPLGKVLVPAIIDQVQGQAFAALQVLKVIEADAQYDELCTRREYARWLVYASSVLSRNTASKVYSAMYIENITELAFDDVTPNDPDFPYIQGLAEAGVISSKLSMPGLSDFENDRQNNMFFFPDSTVSRQDLVSWKMVLERRELPKVDKNDFYRCTGYVDINKINPDALPALVADINSGEQSITALAFGFTRLFQPDKPVTKAQAAIALATGDYAEVVSEELTRIEAESLAETAVNEHDSLVAQVEKELKASFEKELAREKEKIDTLENLAEEARLELELLRKQTEAEKNDLIRNQVTIESHMEIFSRLRQGVEEQLQSIISKKTEISFERERISKLREEVETKNQAIVKLQFEIEVERRALSMARAWAEEEAKRAREHARALEEATERWEKHDITVGVDDLQNDASFEPTLVIAREPSSAIESIDSGAKLVKKLKEMATELKLRSSIIIENIIRKIDAYISALKQHILKDSGPGTELRISLLSKAKTSVNSFQERTSEFNSTIGDRARKVVEDCREGVDKITQKFKI